jgi:hypothetical protein
MVSRVLALLVQKVQILTYLHTCRAAAVAQTHHIIRTRFTTTKVQTLTHTCRAARTGSPDTEYPWHARRKYTPSPLARGEGTCVREEKKLRKKKKHTPLPLARGGGTWAHKKKKYVEKRKHAPSPLARGEGTCVRALRQSCRTSKASKLSTSKARKLSTSKARRDFTYLMLLCLTLTCCCI